MASKVQHTFFILVLQFTVLSFCYSQSASFTLCDNLKNPIAGAFVFVNNSTIGELTDVNGGINLPITENFEEDLIISHISFENKIIPFDQFTKLSLQDTIFLERSNIELAAVSIKAKRGDQWKKNFKLFSEALLGSGKPAKKTKILNPEVLRFENKNGTLTATAVDLLQIENKYLEYKIQFLLNKLTVKADGSSKYHGYGSFQDISKKPKKAKKKRDKTYERSSNYFFKSLIENQLEDQKYQVSEVRYYNNAFIDIVSSDTLLFFDKETGNYHLHFKEFLQVIDGKVKQLKDNNFSYTAGGPQAARFNSSTKGGATKVRYATSWIYKLAPYLIIDANGQIKNKQHLQEYGYWADQKLANTLPYDYSLPLSKNNATITKASKSNEIDLMLNVAFSDTKESEKALKTIEKNWKDDYIAPLLDLMFLKTDQPLEKDILDLLQKKKGKHFSNYYDGLQWFWKTKLSTPEYYPDLKAQIFKVLDPKFEFYFKDRADQSSINFAEVVWGGVKQDGIPPLVHPKMITSTSQDYLYDDDVVFGIVINGIARAYPKRILAWHEMFIDDFGEKSIAGVYCTLCGTVIAYDQTYDGQKHNLGTSGFLYRSNKLMYDHKTQSLWSTLEGKPVIGPLVNKNIELDVYPVITTTWKEWIESYPDSEVLSLETGHNRDYGTGVAYKNYFATDNLMFPVPSSDNRLKNKDEVVVIRDDLFKNQPIAIAVDFLKEKKLYQDDENTFVAIVSPEGATRFFASEGIPFTYTDQILDDKGNIWEMKETELIGPQNKTLRRIPSHRVFWFAWYNTYPNTLLIK